MGSLFGGGAQQQAANNANGLVNQALGPIVNSIGNQIGSYQNGPQSQQYGATSTAYNQLFGDSGIQSPGAATGNYNSQIGAASNLGQIGQGGTANQQSAYGNLNANANAPYGSVQAQNGLLNQSGYQGAQNSLSQQLSGMGTSANPYAQQAAGSLTGGGMTPTGANQATNNLLNFSSTQAPEVAAAQNVNNASNASLNKTLLSQLGGVANPGALAQSLDQQGAQANAQNAQALQSQLVGQNLSAQQAAGGLSNQTAGLYNSAVGQGGALGNSINSLQQGALEGAGSLNSSTQNTINSALQGAGSLANQNQSNATSAYGTAGSIADNAASQYGQDQSNVASIFGNLQQQQQGSQQNAYGDLASMLGLDNSTLQSFLGAGSGAAQQYGQQGQYNQNLANNIQQGNQNAFGSLLGGIGSLFGGGL